MKIKNVKQKVSILLIILIGITIGSIGGSGYINLRNEKYIANKGIIIPTKEIPKFNEEEIVRLTNIERSKNNLSILKINQLLTKAANKKIDYMVDKNYWAHDAPDGTTPWKFIKNAGYEYEYAGENLARGYATSDEVVQSWMNSKPHREDILNPYYKEVGVAIRKVYLLGEDTDIVVQMFGNLLEENIQVDSKNNSPNKIIQPQASNTNEITNYCSRLNSLRTNWANARGRVSDEDLNHLIDLFDRQITFCNTLLGRISSKPVLSNEDNTMWDAITKLSYESEALTIKLNGH